ncbi:MULTISPECIES: thiamine pyrophosphate-binding protein [unclassified Halomonas]|uniref:alpha-keto acid decarboxylase family protein n=1 Tax=unclassified Halomonas TaxID=2609666 RepID=UPI0028842C17|nr:MULTISPECIES: thiamine pyrophosphate-binding protein [unclassified Halomonas]MDT0502523.1 thiamine pyrophosphate-binding protein [Halomonas sp. PAR7]MDT0512755.1 thiamine pyrophosphate-binding protein [Halomonas sp. LES1]MDT0591927.1 thiamine pyrophosphate-binding protein [Halomonas sp. PAR8]
MQTTVGEFLFTRLRQAGVTEVIGVPGDFNLNLLEQLEDMDGIRFVGVCNELNAAYAADGYARRRGIGALMTTYGVGELSALCGIAGANSEHLPVFSISGAPPLFATQNRFRLHHSLADGNFDNMLLSMAPFTATAVHIDSINAVEEIDRALHLCLRKQRPVHIQIPSDVSHLKIEAPDTPFDVRMPASDPERLAAALAHVQDKLASAKRPAILTDMDADRHDLIEGLRILAGRANIPYAQLPTAKALLDENSPLFLGTYAGEASSADVRERIESSDFLITTSPRFIESNSGNFTAQLPFESVVDIRNHRVTVGPDYYEGVVGSELLAHLVDTFPEHSETNTLADTSTAVSPQQEPGNASDPLTHSWLWPRMAQFLRPDDIVIAEAGTSNIGLSGQRLPANTAFVASNIWGAIGYTLPALFGSMLAEPNRRHLLFIGDGSFQFTAQELSTILRHDQRPIIVLIDNAGYTIERWILGMDRTYNDVAAWDYGHLPKIFDAQTTMRSYHASTHEELDDALAHIESSEHGAFLVLHLDPKDAPEGLKAFGPAVADFDYGPTGPRNS